MSTGKGSGGGDAPELTYRLSEDGGYVEGDDGGNQIGVLDPSTWSTYRKVALTRATRIEGPFTVETSEGPLRCADGYLAVDARGYPYPIAADEFDLIYQPATPAPTVVARLLELQAELETRRGENGVRNTDPMVGRALSMAITSIEDTRSRYTEARARQLGCFKPADLDRLDPEAAQAYLDTRDDLAAILAAREAADAPLQECRTCGTSQPVCGSPYADVIATCDRPASPADA